MFLAHNTFTGELKLIDEDITYNIPDKLMRLYDVELQHLENWDFWKLPDKAIRISGNITFNITEA